MAQHTKNQTAPRQIQKTGPGRNVGDIGDPQSIGAVGVELPLDEVYGRLRLGIGPRRNHKPTQRRAPKARRSHQARHALATDADPVIVGQLGLHVRRSIRVARASLYRFDFRRQDQIRSGPMAHRAILPRIEPAPQDPQQAAHRPNRMGGLVRLHEPEERFEVPLSVANQAAALDRISRSSWCLRFSRRRRDNSSRSALVSPPSPLPASRCACFSHRLIDYAEGPKAFDSDACVLLLRTNSTICRLNFAAYRKLRSAISNSSKSHTEAPTKTAQLQTFIHRQSGAKISV